MKKEVIILLIFIAFLFFSDGILSLETSSIMYIQYQGINHTIKLNEIYENSVLITLDDKITKTILLNTSVSWLKSNEWPADKPILVGDVAISVDEIVNNPTQGKPYATLLLGLTNITLVEGDKKNITLNGVNHTLWLAGVSNRKPLLSIDGAYTEYYNQYNRHINSLTISFLKVFEAQATFQNSTVTFLILKTVNLTRYQPSTCIEQCVIKGDMRCASTKVYQTCGNYNEDSCLEWGNDVICQNNEICSDGACVEKISPNPSCINQCQNIGEKTCVSSSAYKVCNNNNEKNCLEWSNSISCEQVQICKNGNCEEMQQKECEEIGLRQSGKYCSIEYKLITQKADSINCENDFECKTNICSESKCAIKIIPPNPDNKIIWIIIGAIVVIAIITIVLFFIFKNRE
ncbi:hypothetical protein HYW75_05715 [Candidatus Pacearchaeota archaeon]|nr:hypothetical protein [Candidatus Pacearchaeota archaeon]